MESVARVVGFVAALSLVAGCASTGPRTTAASGAAPALEAKVQGLPARPGLFTLYVDGKEGKLWARLPAPDAAGRIGEYLYAEALVTGLGSNPVGLDRGQLGPGRVVTLRRVGGRVLAEEQNLRYRALSDDAAERAAVEESFATSVLWAQPVAGESKTGELLVDFTSLAVRDAHGVVATLKATGQGSFSLDGQRSAIDLDRCLAFPDNVELQAVLTFASAEPGPLVQETTPSPDAVTVRQHVSLVRLPEGGYAPRALDPRAGSYAIGFADYASALDEPLRQNWIVRHRLKKLDPAAPSSKVEAPIVFYVDRGAPEPVRGALVEGASWWADAFEAAGFEDAFRVEVLPADAHPWDIRYHVIQWVHRSTRGWSYGGGLIDPRTGEMIQGRVWLGSLRVRQDRLLFEGLLGADGTGSGGAEDPVQLALARLRQLAAHEVGHALGLTHNFAGSTYGRASVMDDPAPLVQVDVDGALDASHAYDSGMGAWDRHAIRWAYAEFPPGVDEKQALDSIVREGLKAGLSFVADHHARPLGSAHPDGSLWDNEADPVAALDHALRVRRIALEQFGERNVRAGAPLSTLRDTLVPLYLHHRFQIAAAAKLLGGLQFGYNLRGDGQPPAAPVPGARQREALGALLRAMAPDELDLPESILQLLLPLPPGHEGDAPEHFPSATDPAFDALSAAAVAADLVAQAILQPQRCARLVDSHRRDPDLPGLGEVVDAVVAAAFVRPSSARSRRLAETTQNVVVGRMVDLVTQPECPAPVRSLVEAKLFDLQLELVQTGETEREAMAHRLHLARALKLYFQEGRWTGSSLRAPAAPPGEPIGNAFGCAFDDPR